MRKAPGHTRLAFMQNRGANVTMVSPWFPERGAQVVWSALTHECYWCDWWIPPRQTVVRVANAATGDSNIETVEGSLVIVPFLRRDREI